MRGVVIIELDLPDDDPGALGRTVQALGRPRYAVRLSAAVRGEADRILAELD